MKKIILLSFSFLLIFTALFAQAQNARDSGLFPCVQDITSGGQITGDACNFSHFLQLFNNFIQFVLYYIVVPLTVFGILYIGFTFVKESDNPNVKNKAKQQALYLVGGFVLTFGAYAIVKTILDLVLSDSSSSAEAIRSIFIQN